MARMLPAPHHKTIPRTGDDPQGNLPDLSEMELRKLIYSSGGHTNYDIIMQCFHITSNQVWACRKFQWPYLRKVAGYTPFHDSHKFRAGQQNIRVFEIGRQDDFYLGEVQQELFNHPDFYWFRDESINFKLRVYLLDKWVKMEVTAMTNSLLIQDESTVADFPTRVYGRDKPNPNYDPTATSPRKSAGGRAKKFGGCMVTFMSKQGGTEEKAWVSELAKGKNDAEPWDITVESCEEFVRSKLRANGNVGTDFHLARNDEGVFRPLVLDTDLQEELNGQYLKDKTGRSLKIWVRGGLAPIVEE